MKTKKVKAKGKTRHRIKANVSGELPFAPGIEAIQFGNWLGYKYYRVNEWKWRQIKDESDKTEYPLHVLYDKFKRAKGN